MDRRSLSLAVVLLTLTMSVTRARVTMVEYDQEPGGVLLELYKLIDSLEDRLEATNSRLEATNNRLKETNDHLEATDDLLEATNDLVEATNDRLEVTNERMEAANKKQVSSIKRLDNTVTEMKTDMVEMTRTDDALNLKYDSLKKDYNNLVTENAKQQQLIKLSLNNSNNAIQEVTGVRQCTASRVAFTAGLTVIGGAVQTGQIVKYNHQVYNPDNAYSTATGSFTCPVAGVYVFTVVAVSKVADLRACLVLRHNGAGVSKAHSLDKDYWAATSTSVSLHLAVGDTVDVAAYCTSYLITDIVPWNTFTGVLMSADTCL